MPSTQCAVSTARYAAIYSAAVVVRLAFAFATHSFTNPQNHYFYQLTPQGVEFLAPGFAPPGGYYATKLFYALCGNNLVLFGLFNVLLGALIPVLIVSISQRLIPSRDDSAAQTAGWLAVFFPPLVFLSGTWRYMVFAAILGALHLELALRRRLLSTMLVGALLLLTRPDFFLGALAIVLLAPSVELSSFRKVALVLVPVLLLALHSSVTGGSGRTTNFWYNVDAGANPRSRIALINYGPDLWFTEATLDKQVYDEALHRANVVEFAQVQPMMLAETLVLKVLKLIDLRRDGAMNERPMENVVYSLSTLFVLLCAWIGIGQLGFAASASAIGVMIGYAIPMVLVFSIDRSRILLQSLWLVPCAHCVQAVLGAVRKQLPGMPESIKIFRGARPMVARQAKHPK
jgi:hypothetical protein